MGREPATDDSAPSGAHHQVSPDDVPHGEESQAAEASPSAHCDQARSAGSQAPGRADDARYLLRASAQEQGQRAGNPPSSRLLDTQIADLAEEYPEYSALDIAQAEIHADARRNWNSEAYPPYAGPGYTEPPVNWEGWHQPRSACEKDHYWDDLASDWPGPRLPAHGAGIPERDESFAQRDVEAGQ
jgi:hypothetical protein